VDQRSSDSTWRSKPTTFVLLRPCCLTLVGLLLSFLLRLLLRKVPSDHASANRPDYRVVPSIVTGHSAHDRILGAACGVRSDLSAQNVVNKPVALWLETVFSEAPILAHPRRTTRHPLTAGQEPRSQMPRNRRWWPAC
jgi:hypothetical protein